MLAPKSKVRYLYLVTDIFFLSLAFCIPYFLRFRAYLLPPRWNLLIDANLKEYLFIFLLWGAFIVGAMKKKNLYTTDRTLTIPREIYLVLISSIYVAVVIAALLFFAKFKFFSRWIYFLSFFLSSFFLAVWRVFKRMILRLLVKRGFHNFNVLLIGASPVSRMIAAELNRRPFLGLRVVGVLDDERQGIDWELPILGKLSDFETVCTKFFIDEVFVTIPSRGNVISEINRIAKDKHVGVRIVPQDFEAAHSVMDLEYLGFVPILTYKERELHPTELFAKRLLDILISSFLLILLLPVFCVLGFLIKLDSVGPLVYSQKRMGRKGKIFNLYKFRSMVKDADLIKSQLQDWNEVDDGVIFKIRKDPRITRVGRFLRRYSLDELPQLINVLKGDMSLVGPRPFPVEESQQFKVGHLPRLNIKPGITGLAQIRGRSDLPFSKWVRWDLWYIRNWSFWLDLKILWQTAPTILKGKGAY